MALVHQKLYGSDDLSRINLGEYLEELVYYLCESYNISSEEVRLEINVEPIYLNIETVIPCGTIVTELVSNIFKYAFPKKSGDGDRDVKISRDTANAVAMIKCYERPEDRQIILIIGDNGIGLPESLEFPKTKSLGLQLVWDLTKQLKATLELDRSNGTQYKLTFAELYYPDRF
jgi:two-component sensor histidine kinase